MDLDNVRIDKVIGFAQKIFEIDKQLSRLKDGCKEPEISCKTLYMGIMGMEIIRIRSAYQKDRYYKRHPLIQKLIGAEKRTVASDTTMQRRLPSADLNGIRKILYGLVKQAMRNKVHEKGSVGGLRMWAIDGSGVETACKIRCKLCHEVKNKDKEVVGYVHKHVRLISAGSKPHLCVDVEPIHPGESETTASIRLLKRVFENMGTGYFDLISADGLYKGPFISFLSEWKVKALIKSREERLEIIGEIERLSEGIKPTEGLDEERLWKYKIWDGEGFKDWGSVKGLLRVLKIEEEKIKEGLQETQYAITTLFANERGGDARSVRDMVHAHWSIENNGFRDLKSYWDFRHKLTHQEEACEAMWLLQSIAFTLSGLFLVRKLWRIGQAICKGLLTMVELVHRFRESVVELESCLFRRKRKRLAFG